MENDLNPRLSVGRVDWWSILIYAALVLAGWLNIYAAVYDDRHASIFDLSQRYGMQLVWVGVSAFMAVSILLIDAKYYHILAYPLYWGTILILVGVLFFGKEVNGAKSWIMIGPVALQPTEFVKFTTSLALARYMSSYTFDIHRPHDLLRVGAIIGLPVLIVMLQNDTGSALVYGSFLFMFYREGFNRWVYVVLIMVVSLFVFSFLLDPAALLIVLLLVCVISEGLTNGYWRSKLIYVAALTLFVALLYMLLPMLGGSISLHTAILVGVVLSLGIGFIHNEFAETIGIFCAIFLATGVAFWFEYDAMRKFDLLNSTNDDTPVKVVRDGEVMEIPKQDVVVGDVVILQSGEEVPADGRLHEAVSLKVNESTLTGEPMIDKTTDPAHFHHDATYPSNEVLRGTTVIEGHGVMVVEKVGDATEFGKVAEQSTVESEEETPLNLQLGRLSKLIGRAGISLAVLTFVALLVKGFLFGGLLEADWITIAERVLQYFMVAVTLIVVAVPEGLPMSVTLSLAVNMRRMLKTNNLVRKMHACETMGAITVICTDKTGTLTRNEMRVHETKFYQEGIDDLIREGIAANSTAFLDTHGKVIGNPTEGALLLWLRDQGVDYAALRDGAKVVDQLTFTTERKFMATLVDSPLGGRYLYIKGAPEIVLNRCASFPDKTAVEAQLAAYQNMAMRTLGFAYGRCDGAQDCGEALERCPLAFVGIAAISDPVRDDVPAAVHECLDAGIGVKIVTGDTPATAKEIGRQIGLWTAEDTDYNHITGADFAALSDEELLERVQALKIMSRARPLDKQRLVRLLQQRGEVVAVTGDGTNDAPALNFAQVGLSMGTGTSVAKEASDITLLDDSFSSIATAVMWGRSLYRNIQRFVLFQLTINVVAVVIVLLGSVFGSELPLTVTQMLWVNLIMDTFAALALASLPPSRSVMKEKPRKSSDFIITPAMSRSILGTAALFIVVLLGMLFWFGEAITPYELSAFFTVFVMLQFWNMFNAKGFASTQPLIFSWKGCYAFFAVLLLILVGQFIIVTWGGEVFRTVPLTWNDWLLIIGSTSLVMWVGEIARTIRYFSRKRG